jgi:lysozyme
MKISEKGAQLIADFEGFRAHPYRDAVGVWTIGYGSTKGVGPNTNPVTRTQALKRMMDEVDATYGAAVDKLNTSARLSLNQNQFDALTSFVYNVGPGGIGPDTTVGKRLRAHDFDGAADALLMWNKAGGRVLAGLTRRRSAERALFLSKPTEGLEGYTDSEKRWIREYDRLLHENRDVDRRRVLRRVMKEQRQRIWRAAQSKAKGGDGQGWEHMNRRARYKSLKARSD